MKLLKFVLIFIAVLLLISGLIYFSQTSLEGDTGGSVTSLSVMSMDRTPKLTDRQQLDIHYVTRRQQLRPFINAGADCSNYSWWYAARFRLGGEAFRITQSVRACTGARLSDVTWNTPTNDQSWFSQWRPTSDWSFNPSKGGYVDGNRTYRRIGQSWRICVILTGNNICETENPYLWLQVKADGSFTGGGAH